MRALDGLGPLLGKYRDLWERRFDRLAALLRGRQQEETEWWRLP